MASEKYIAIRQAILNKHQVIAEYHGKIRKLCPHAIGHTNGKEYALFYQFDGESNSRTIDKNDPTKNWRCLNIAELVDLYDVPGEWNTSLNHTKQQTCIKDIDLEVEY